MAALATPAFSAAPALRANGTSLRGLAAAKGILFGSAAATYELRDADFTALLPRETAILVPEYEMKRNIIEPKRAMYDFFRLRRACNFFGRAWLGHARPPPGLA